MKKNLLPLSLAAVFFILCFTGCNNSAKNSDNDGWIEVQSITYYLQDNAYTLTSKYKLDLTITEITESEYQTAYEKAKSDSSICMNNPTNDRVYPSDSFTTYLDININRTETISKLKQYKTYYHKDFNTYYKSNVNNYTLFYVEINLFDDNSIEIKYQDDIIKVLPTSYKITYFND